MSNPSPPENWSLTYETNPQANDGVAQGDDWIRQLKLDTRKRLEVEHQFGSVTGDDNGLHRVGSARCFVQTAAPTVIEVVDHSNTGGAGTATLSANATNSSPAETVGHGRGWFVPDGSFHIYNGAWVRAGSFPRGHLAGLNLSVTGGSLDITISPGECRAGRQADRSLVNITLNAAFTKQLDATWAAGNNAGGLVIGVIAPNTWYHVFAIVKPDGTADAAFDTHVEANNVLGNAAVITAGFTSYRRVGSILTLASGLIGNFIQHGDLFVWSAPSGLHLLTAQNYTGADTTLSLSAVPASVKTVAHIRFAAQSFETDMTFLLRPGGTTIGSTPSLTASPLSQLRGALDQSISVSLLTNASQQVVVRGSDPSANYYWQVDGYEDARGRWD